MRSPLRFWLVFLVLSCPGCLPDLGAWEIVAAPRDSGIAGDTGPARDGGPNPIDLGPSCPDPHLVVATVDSSQARLIRYDLAARRTCRTSPILELARDYGNAIRSVDYHPEGGLMIGTDDAVIAMGNDGFPRWRFEIFDDGTFAGESVFTWGAAAIRRTSVFWTPSSSSTHQMLFLDSEGALVSVDDIETPFFMSMGAAHPDGSVRFLGASTGGEIFVYQLSDSVTDFEDTTDGTPLFSPDPGHTTTFGSRADLGADLSLGALAITHVMGVLRWSEGAGVPTSAHTCAMCTRYQAAIPGPGNLVYAVCDGASDQLLVQMDGSGCEILIDGSGLGSHTISDIALVHSAF